MKYFWLLLLMIVTGACNNEQKSGYDEYRLKMESSGDFNPYVNFSNEEGSATEDFIAPNNPELEEIPGTTESSNPSEYGSLQVAYAENQSFTESTSSNSKKLIRTAIIEIKVDNYDNVHSKLNDLLKKYRAEITNEAQNRTSNGYRYNFQIRVLPADLEAFLGEVEQLASFIYSKNVQVQDVTRQYVDLESRLASERAVIAQYRELLKSAKNVTDVLAVSEKLNAAIEEMESNEAQLRVLKDQVRLSTVELVVFDEFILPEVAQRNFWSRLGEGLYNGWNILLSIIIGLVTAWPVVLIIITSFWLGRKAWKRSKEEKLLMNDTLNK